ncbi:hypothetical protein Glove_150g89 [Diversispora epigaea]|uniref:Uncharacterized protein n=1 Tax=Diversispora epigaea TaxID=1348612 RepID=A0A397IXY9_9GLOM|nr:hypothetical protein Glove_150g89 [Diversispora epigaea]
MNYKGGELIHILLFSKCTEKDAEKVIIKVPDSHILSRKILTHIKERFKGLPLAPVVIVGSEYISIILNTDEEAKPRDYVSSKDLSEIDLLRQRIIELEAENTKLNNIIKVSIRRRNAELKAEVVKLRYDIEEIKKKDQTVTNTQDALHSTEYNPRRSNFWNGYIKNRLKNEIRERNRERKLLQNNEASHNQDPLSYNEDNSSEHPIHHVVREQLLATRQQNLTANDWTDIKLALEVSRKDLTANDWTNVKTSCRCEQKISECKNKLN